jgi:hypothetical protein
VLASGRGLDHSMDVMESLTAILQNVAREVIDDCYLPYLEAEIPRLLKDRYRVFQGGGQHSYSLLPLYNCITIRHTETWYNILGGFQEKLYACKHLNIKIPQKIDINSIHVPLSLKTLHVNMCHLDTLVTKDTITFEHLIIRYKGHLDYPEKNMVDPIRKVLEKHPETRCVILPSFYGALLSRLKTAIPHVTYWGLFKDAPRCASLEDHPREYTVGQLNDLYHHKVDRDLNRVLGQLDLNPQVLILGLEGHLPDVKDRCRQILDRFARTLPYPVVVEEVQDPQSLFQWHHIFET